MIRTCLILCALTLPTSALGLGFECSFTRYCSERTACGPSELSLKIRRKAGATDLSAYEMETRGRVIAVREIVDPTLESRSYISALEFNTIHLVTVFDGGITRYTSHTPIQDAQSQNFHGTCAVTN